MTRACLALLLALAALGAAGCGAGAGDGSVEAEVLVTHDFGTTELGRRQTKAGAGDTVMRLLQRSFDVETRYGGGFVQSIDGLAGGRRGGRPVDWFYYVNGIEAGEGAQARKPADGDRIWWDHHDWGTAQRIPAVVGSYPEPFASGVAGERLPVRVDCAQDVEDICDEVAQRLREAGVEGVAKANLGASSGIEVLRVVVGRWSDARREPTARLLEDGPQASGVFARPSGDGRRIDLLDPQGKVARTAGAGSGLVAAIRFSEQQPTWFVTGTDEAGVAAAAAALEEGILANRFALGLVEGRGVPLPVLPDDGDGEP